MNIDNFEKVKKLIEEKNKIELSLKIWDDTQKLEIFRTYKTSGNRSPIEIVIKSDDELFEHFKKVSVERYRIRLREISNQIKLC